MRPREQTESQRAYSLTHIAYVQCVCVCVCVYLGGRGESRQKIILCMQELFRERLRSLCLYVRPQQQQQYRIQAIHHCTDKISPLSVFKTTNSIFNVLDNLVVIIHCKIIQSHCSCRTQSIQYSCKTDCINHGKKKHDIFSS